jgi:hypothetical protein
MMPELVNAARIQALPRRLITAAATLDLQTSVSLSFRACREISWLGHRRVAWP